MCKILKNEIDVNIFEIAISERDENLKVTTNSPMTAYFNFQFSSCPFTASARADFTDYQSHRSEVLIRYVARICVIKSLINHIVLKRWHRCTPPAAAKYGCSVIVQKTPEVRHLPTSSSMNKLSFHFHFLHWKFVCFRLSCSVRHSWVVCYESVPITSSHVTYDACSCGN